jgi:hypothetical protein
MLWDVVAISRPKCRSLGHPCLALVLQQHMLGGLQPMCRLLQTSKAARDVALAHCCGFVPLECRPGALLGAADLCFKQTCGCDKET